MSKFIYGIAGPTASGKTSLSISVAKHIDAEIISVDSAVVYRGMNIGTAKPNSCEREGVVHHLMDFIEPTEAFSAADFMVSVNTLKKDIWSRGKQVLLVGGTMLYFKALIEGLSDLPESQADIRVTLELEKNNNGIEHLYKQLSKMDSAAASKINQNDQQRIFRALEVMMISGKKYSELVLESKTGGIGEELKLIAIVPKDRSILHHNIAIRFQEMLDNGFLTEVKKLRENDKLSITSTSMRSIGYRQAWEYLDGDVSYDEFIQKGIAATRQLAKRQLTWIRNWQTGISILNMEDDDNVSKTLKIFGLS